MTKTVASTPEGEAVRRKLVRFIEVYYDAHKIPPSYRELADLCNVSSTSVLAYHLAILERRGYIKRRATLSRTLLVTNEGREYAYQ